MMPARTAQNCNPKTTTNQRRAVGLSLMISGPVPYGVGVPNVNASEAAGGTSGVSTIVTVPVIFKLEPSALVATATAVRVAVPTATPTISTCSGLVAFCVAVKIVGSDDVKDAPDNVAVEGLPAASTAEMSAETALSNFIVKVMLSPDAFRTCMYENSKRIFLARVRRSSKQCSMHSSSSKVSRVQLITRA
jgi:hypothetical protein